MLELIIEGSLADLHCPATTKPARLENLLRDLALSNIERHGGTEHEAMEPRLIAGALMSVDPETLGADQQLEYFTACQRLISWTQARQIRALAGFADQRPPISGETPRQRHPETSKWAAAEVGAALGIGRLSAEMKLGQAQDLVTFLPGMLASHEDGALDQRQLRAVVDGLLTTPTEIWPAVESVVLPLAPSMTPRALEKYVRETAEKLDPEPLAVRHERARATRDVWFFANPDGMAEIGARLPAATARRYFETIHAWALHAKNEGEPSTGSTPSGKPSRAINEYRADVFMDLVDRALDPDILDPDTLDPDTQDPDTQDPDTQDPDAPAREGGNDGTETTGNTETTGSTGGRPEAPVAGPGRPPATPPRRSPSPSPS